MSTTVVQRNLEDDNFVWDTNTMAWVKETQPFIDNAGGTITVSTTGAVTVGSPTLPGTGTLSNVAASASSVTLIAANANRLGLVVVNDSTNNLYVKFGITASATSYTYFIPAIFSNIPVILELFFPVYTGRIDAIWDGTNGAARITELSV